MPRLIRWGLALAFSVLVLALPEGVAGAAGPAWTTYRHDDARSGIDPDSTSPVSPTQAWQSPVLDGPVFGQPLVYGSNVYVATEDDTVYALNAANGSVVWSRHLANPVPSSQLPCGDISPVGITSTPVIDPATGAIYVVADTWDGTNASSIQHVMFGLNTADGSTTVGPVEVDPPGSLHTAQLQRVSLGLDAGKVIIGYGGNDGDCSTYHGWLVAVPEGGGGLQTFEVDSSAADGEGAIWAAGNAPPIDSAGSIWTSTGNGNTGATYQYQESVLKLDPNLSLLDSWAPANWQSLDTGDADLGSSMPVLLPNNLVFQDGKSGTGYLLNGAHLGGIGAEVFSGSVCASFGGGIYVNGIIYVACSGGLRALSLDTTNRRFSALAGWAASGSAIGAPIFAGGLVWSAGWNNGTLYGLDPATGATKFSANLGGLEHFTTPSAGGGLLFVANKTAGSNDQVTAFHIANYTPSSPMPPPNPTPTPTPTPPPPPSAPLVIPPRLSKLHVKVVGHTIRLTLTISEKATVTIRLGQRRWRFHPRRGRHTLVLRWRRLTPGRHRLLLFATDSTGHRSKRYVVHFRYRPKPALRLF